MNQHLQEPRCLENGDPADRLSFIFRGVSMGQLIYKSSGDRVQLVWRPRDKLIMRYFLAKHSFEPHMPKSFSMRGLAQLLDVNVESLDVAEWLAIEARMRSSLDYQPKRIMNEHSSEFGFRYDKEKRRKVYVWPEQLRDTLLKSICQGCQRDGDTGGDCALHIHVREDKHGMEGGGDETGPESPPGPEVEMDPNPRPSVTPAVTRPVSLASVPEGTSVSARHFRNSIHSQQPPRSPYLGHSSPQRCISKPRVEVPYSSAAAPTLPPLQPIFEEMTNHQRALAATSMAYINKCSDLVTASLSLNDPEARLPLYAIMLRGLLPAGVVSDTSDAMLDFLSDAPGVAGRGAVEQLLASVQTLGRELEVVGRRADRAMDKASGVMKAWAEEGYFADIASLSWPLSVSGKGYPCV